MRVPIKLSEAKALKVGDIIYFNGARNADGSRWRCMVNGKVTLWVRAPERVKVPLKRGLYNHGYLTEDSLKDFDLM